MSPTDRMREIDYDDLPAPAKARVASDDFLSGFACPYRNSVVCWVIDEISGIQREVEWLAEAGTEIVVAERLSAYPAEEPLPTQGSYGGFRFFSIDERNNCIVENFVLTDMRGGAELRGSQYLYSVTRLDTMAFCANMIRKNDASASYLAMNDEQKSQYWAHKLYMLRRQSGPDCTDEDFFAPDLREDMIRVDPAVKRLLKPIIVELAEMEHEDVDRMLFSAKRVLD
jgi:hypothetical protein